MTIVDHHHEAIVMDAPELKKEPLSDVGLAVVGIDVGMAVGLAAVAATEADGIAVVGARVVTGAMVVTGWGVVGTGAKVVTGWGVVGTGARVVTGWGVVGTGAVVMGAGVGISPHPRPSKVTHSPLLALSNQIALHCDELMLSRRTMSVPKTLLPTKTPP